VYQRLAFDKTIANTAFSFTCLVCIGTVLYFTFDFQPICLVCFLGDFFFVFYIILNLRARKNQRGGGDVSTKKISSHHA
jgi:hypothetical protein